MHQDASGQALELALAYGTAIGCGRVGLLETTFAEETESDLFGEQAVLCGGVTALMKAGFETLVEAGYQPEIAYYECINELKLIVDLIYEGGFEYMRYSVSDVAEYGDLSRGRTVDRFDHVRETMRGILDDIRCGAFARELFADDDAGRPGFAALRAHATRAGSSRRSARSCGRSPASRVCSGRSRKRLADRRTSRPSDPAKRHSAALTDGVARAPARAMLKGTGFTDDDLARPLIGVATSWIETMPCNLNQRKLARAT